MNQSARYLAIVLLLLNGLGALYGGGSLMYDPTGVHLQLPAAWIELLPFRNYFFPGLVLFVVNGLFSMFVMVLAIIRTPRYAWYIVAQGIVLMGWILIQMIIVHSIEALHIVMASIGITLAVLGLIQVINSLPSKAGESTSRLFP